MTTQAAPQVRTRTAALVKSWTAVEQAAHGLLAPITSTEQHEHVLEVIDTLMITVANTPDHPLISLISILADHVEVFESRQYPVPASPPHRVLAFLMEQHDLTQQGLGAAVGIDQSNLSKMLAGTRAFTVGQVKKLSEFFHVGPTVFIG